MLREHRRWNSPSLGRDMDLLIFGHAGARMLVFPTSMGRYFEWEDRGMTLALADHLEHGRLQMFCVDSVDEESWYNKGVHPGIRALRHTQFERYILEEVLPFTAHANSTAYLIATGASFGAYHAVNLTLRHPRVVNRVIGLSGLYDMKQITDGYSDDTVYFNNPSDFLRHEHDDDRLSAMRALDLILVTGRDDSALANNQWMSSVLSEKGIPHRLRIWDGWAHDWPYWRHMIRTYIDGSN